MNRRALRPVVFLLPLVLLSGCERTKSDTPLSPSLAGPLPGVDIQPPKPIEPAMSAQIAIDQQPIQLTVENATTTGVRPLSYILEMSSDASFGSQVFSQTGIQPGANGKTSFRIPGNLSAERTYYWRAKADDGANSSGYSAIANFRVYTPVIIQAPVLQDPPDNTTIQTQRPTFTVQNSQKTGPAGQMQYLFEVGTDVALANRIVSIVMNETPNTTSYTVPVDLTASTRYFWRVKAIDPGHESAYSPTRSFITSAPAPVPAPVPIPQPPPGGGGSVASDQINMSQATILNSPTDLASWPASAAITTLDLGPNGIFVDFTKKNGAGSWPDITPPGWSGPLQYTLGMCLSISGRWYCSAVVEFWRGLDRAGGPPQEFALNWFYDPARWAPMTGHQPSVGETIGFFVCAGDCRNNVHGDLSPVKERTNVVLISMPGSGGGTYRF